MYIKRCSDCGRFLGEDSFGYQNKKKGYLMSYCKRCNGNRNYLWQLDNPEYKKQWCKNNKEYYKQYYQNNKKQILKHRKQLYKNNQDKYCEYTRQYRENNKEKVYKSKKQYRKDNTEKCHEYDKKWSTINRYRKTAIENKRRIRKENQTTKLTNMEKRKYNFMYEVANTMADYVLDHIKPVSKCGSDHPDNLQILKKSLNAEKYNKWPLTKEEGIRYKGYRLK